LKDMSNNNIISIKHFLLLIVLFSAPFYLVFKYSIFYGTQYWIFPAILVILLFANSLLGFVSTTSPHYSSSINILMRIIFLYYIYLCFQAIFLGSTIDGLILRIWQHLIPILIFFPAVNILSNKQRILFTMKFMAIVSVLIAILFLTEWVSVNIFRNASFPWTLKMIESEAINSQYGSLGGKSIFDFSSSVFRVGGPLMQMNSTALFIVYSVAYYLSKLSFRVKFTYIINISISVIALFLISGRTAVGAFVIAIVLTNKLIKIKSLEKLLFEKLWLILIMVSIIIFFGSNFINSIVQKLYYAENIFMIAGPISAILDEFNLYIYHILENPIIFIVGSGFGYFEDPSLHFYSADFGIAYFLYMIGLFGTILIILFLTNFYKVVRLISKLLAVGNDEDAVTIFITSVLFVITAIVSSIHYVPLFHFANYIFFYISIAAVNNLFVLSNQNKKLKHGLLT